jgi:hypothetical protein
MASEDDDHADAPPPAYAAASADSDTYTDDKNTATILAEQLPASSSFSASASLLPDTVGPTAPPPPVRS